MDNFEEDLIDLFGERIKVDDEFAKRIYAAITNVYWHSEFLEVFDTVESFRCAGGLIAAIKGSGDYMDWYGCAAEGCVDDDISEALLARGWIPEVL